MGDTERPEAMVEFDYIAQEPDELTIRKGDIIKDIKTQPGGWWEGTLGDKRGMFPDNFVRILADAPKQKESPVVTLRTMGGRRCRVLFSYLPVNDDELRLEVNDVIDVLGEVEEGWWKGKLRDMVGVFPSNFVSEMKDPLDDGSGMQSSSESKSRNSIVSNESSDGALQSSPDSSHEPGAEDADAPVLPPKPVKELCRVLFPYEAANDDELTIKEGDVILLLSREVADKGWWRGELRGRIGVFPDNFVEVIQQEEVSKKPERPPSKSLLSTTNRIRDNITKPTTNSSRNDHVDVAPSKKPQDEKPVFPPVPGKKPLLPPPVKKPQRIVASTGNSQGSKPQEPAERTFPDTVDGIGSSRVAQSNYGVPKSNSRDEVPEFDSVERSAMLNHPTAGRVKAPRRRLPKNMHSRENDASHGLVNGNQEELEPMKPNGPHVSPQASSQATPQAISQAARQWENKSKAPWMEELKMSQARKHPTVSPAALGASSTPSALSTSSAPGPLKSPATANSASEHSASVRDPPHHAVGRHSLGAESNIPATADFPLKPSFTSSSSKHTSERPVSRDMTSGLSYSGLPHKPHSLSTPSLHAVDESHASDINQNLKSSLKQSPSAISDIPVKTEGSSMSGSHHGSHGPGHTGTSMPSVQYLELMEKIVKLEKSVEQQRATFTQAIKEITDKLNEERNRRTHLEQELDKLTNLVTQV